MFLNPDQVVSVRNLNIAMTTHAQNTEYKKRLANSIFLFENQPHVRDNSVQE